MSWLAYGSFCFALISLWTFFVYRVMNREFRALRKEHKELQKDHHRLRGLEIKGMLPKSQVDGQMYHAIWNQMDDLKIEAQGLREINSELLSQCKQHVRNYIRLHNWASTIEHHAYERGALKAERDVRNLRDQIANLEFEVKRQGVAREAAELELQHRTI